MDSIPESSVENRSIPFSISPDKEDFTYSSSRAHEAFNTVERFTGVTWLNEKRQETADWSTYGRVEKVAKVSLLAIERLGLVIATFAAVVVQAFIFPVIWLTNGFADRQTVEDLKKAGSVPESFPNKQKELLKEVYVLSTRTFRPLKDRMENLDTHIREVRDLSGKKRDDALSMISRLFDLETQLLTQEIMSGKKSYEEAVKDLKDSLYSLQIISAMDEREAVTLHGFFENDIKLRPTTIEGRNAYVGHIVSEIVEPFSRYISREEKAAVLKTGLIDSFKKFLERNDEESVNQLARFVYTVEHLFIEKEISAVGLSSQELEICLADIIVQLEKQLERQLEDERQEAPATRFVKCFADLSLAFSGEDDEFIALQEKLDTQIGDVVNRKEEEKAAEEARIRQEEEIKKTERVQKMNEWIDSSRHLVEECTREIQSFREQINHLGKRVEKELEVSSEPMTETMTLDRLFQFFEVTSEEMREIRLRGDLFVKEKKAAFVHKDEEKKSIFSFRGVEEDAKTAILQRRDQLNLDEFEKELKSSEEKIKLQLFGRMNEMLVLQEEILKEQTLRVQEESQKLTRIRQNLTSNQSSVEDTISDDEDLIKESASPIVQTLKLKQSITRTLSELEDQDEGLNTQSPQ